MPERSLDPLREAVEHRVQRHDHEERRDHLPRVMVGGWWLGPGLRLELGLGLGAWGWSWGWAWAWAWACGKDKIWGCGWVRWTFSPLATQPHTSICAA